MRALVPGLVLIFAGSSSSPGAEAIEPARFATVEQVPMADVQACDAIRPSRAPIPPGAMTCERLARQGFGPAQRVDAADIYSRDRAGPPDYVQADLWLSLAAAGSEKGALSARDRVVRKIAGA